MDRLPLEVRAHLRRIRDSHACMGLPCPWCQAFTAVIDWAADAYRTLENLADAHMKRVQIPTWKATVREGAHGLVLSPLPNADGASRKGG
jgi:hypothetical protein